MLKPLLKDSLIYGLPDFLLKFISFATFPIYTHLFEVSEFGTLSLAITLGNLLAVVANCGLNNAVQRHYMDPNRTREEQRQIVSTGFYCLICFSFLIIGIALSFAYWFNDHFKKDGLSWGLIALAVIPILPTQIFQFSLDLIRLYFRPWIYSLLNGCVNGLIIALTLLFCVSFHWGIAGFLAGSFMAFLLTAPCALHFIRKDLAWCFDISKGKQMIAYGYSFIFVGVAYWIFESMDRWMLAEMADLVEVGIYSIAFKVGMAMILLNTAFARAWVPLALKAFQHQDRYRMLYSKTLTAWVFFLLLVATGISLFSQELLIFLTPPDYWRAASVIPLICIGLLFSGTTQVTVIGISLEKKTLHLSIATWGTAVVNFVFNFILIPKYGASGAALATLISYFFLTVYYLVCSQKLHPIPLEYGKLFLFFVLTGISLGFTLWIVSIKWMPCLVLIKGGFFILIGAVGFMSVYGLKLARAEQRSFS